MNSRGRVVLAVMWGVLSFTCTTGLVICAEPAVSQKPMRIFESYPPDIQQRRDRQRAIGVPAGSSEEVQAVFERLKLWKTGQLVRVCFFGGSRDVRARIARAALPWTKSANLRLDFGDLDSPRDCDGATLYEIRIGFNRPGYWSVTGQESVTLLQAHETSFNLQGYDGNEQPDEPEFSSYVLHEFGHAIGFGHEHQHPSGTCDLVSDDLIAQYMAEPPNKWPRAYALEQIKRLSQSDVQTIGQMDAESIMFYSLDERVLKEGKNSKCYRDNQKLSKLDEQAARELYPSNSVQGEQMRANRRARYEALIEDRATGAQLDLARTQAEMMTSTTVSRDRRLKVQEAILGR
jgi:hypothetical protein